MVSFISSLAILVSSIHTWWSLKKKKELEWKEKYWKSKELGIDCEFRNELSE